ncbi:MAG: D-glycerate dehydrogenase [Rhodobacteraceae bacterium]|nr:D-glycerate dehydrogenase [Paracoccaceae bacterium]
MYKLLITRPIPQKVIKRAQNFFDVHVRQSVIPSSKFELINALQKYDAIIAAIGDKFSKEIFESSESPRAKIISNFGVGYDHLDLNSARQKNIQITNTPDVVTNATADIAMTLMLMTARRAGEGDRLVRSGAWKGWNPMQMLGTHVTGSTLGVIGMGRIGKAIARRCNLGFDMPVYYYNRSKVTDLKLKNCYQVDSLDELFGKADIIVIAVPGGPETYHLIDKKAFAKMKSSSILINIARGEIIKESDLIDALQKKEIGGVGLDVYEFEPLISPQLVDLENAVLLPHLGTAALSVREEMGLIALKNIIDILLEKKETSNLIN